MDALMIMKNMKKELWERLSADPSDLALDQRVEEEPEDLFVRIANRGQRDEVVAGLGPLIVEQFLSSTQEGTELSVRFLRRALRLCDDLATEEARPILKVILLQEKNSLFGNNLDELQELAARVLSGLERQPSDFKFWREVARLGNAALPYALNAAVEIDIQRGLRLIHDAYVESETRSDRDFVDWGGLLEIARMMHGPDRYQEAFTNLGVTHIEFLRLAGLTPQDISLTSARVEGSIDEAVGSVSQITTPPYPKRINEERYSQRNYMPNFQAYSRETFPQNVKLVHKRREGIDVDLRALVSTILSGHRIATNRIGLPEGSPSFNKPAGSIGLTVTNPLDKRYYCQ